jgi:uncharacterized protein (DUF2062 family)
MPRRFLKKITPHPLKLQKQWFLRIFGKRMTHPGLWSLQRRAVTGAFAAGLAISFVPLPIHLPLGALIAIVWRLNVPTIALTLLIVNPLTALPIYYAAYRVGAAVLRADPQRFAFELSFEWLQHGLGPIWKPFLVGCLICSTLVAALGWLTLEALWRWRVRYKYRRRPAAASAPGESTGE